MKTEEKLASNYLGSLDLGEVVYQPDGQQTPDFLVGGKIVVEVRRLNRNVDAQDGPQGVEKVQFDLLQLVKKALRSSEGPKDGRSWFVSYKFQRPIDAYKLITQRVEEHLRQFSSNPIPEYHARIAHNFEMSLKQASESHNEVFVLGGYVDRDSSGWVIPDLTKNVQYCSAEKIKKVQRVRDRYSEWWLLLVDQINYGTPEKIKISHPWGKLILINPLDPRLGYEIASS